MALVTINISGSPINGACNAPKTKKGLYELVKGNNVILHVGNDTTFERIINAYWSTKAHATSFRVTHSELGEFFEVVTQREAMKENRATLGVVK